MRIEAELCEENGIFVLRIPPIKLGIEVGNLSRALTQKEIAVLHLLERGLVNKEIASELRMEVRAVKFHVSNILNKTGMTRAELIFRAGRQDNANGAKQDLGG